MSVKKRFLLLSVFLFCFWSLQAQELSTTEESSNDSNNQLQTTPEAVKYNPNLPMSLQPWQTFNLESMSLEDLTKASLMESDYSANLIQTLKEQQTASASQIALLEQSLESSQGVLSKLQTALNQVGERLQAANEDVAYVYTLLDQQDLKLKRAKRNSVINFSIGAVSFGVGMPLIVEGIVQDNSTMLWSGVGISVGSGIIWAILHFGFDLL